MGGDRVALARESIYEGNKRIVTIEGGHSKGSAGETRARRRRKELAS